MDADLVEGVSRVSRTSQLHVALGKTWQSFRRGIRSNAIIEILLPQTR